MVKTETKRKDEPKYGIKKRLYAALCMLLVSLILLITATYAWFTLSTAPEVSKIATTVTGNGSLELALMPDTGLLGDIKSGLASENNGGSVVVTQANTTWGNIVDLTDTSYGLSKISLLPAKLTEDGLKAGNPLSIPTYGFDGRAEENLQASTLLAKWDQENAKFTDPATYGIRAIAVKGEKTMPSEDGSATSAETMTTYGYVVDLAVRINANKEDGSASKLLLQTDGAQRVYADGTNPDTMGLGSTMTFDANGTGVNLKGLMNAIRVTFVSNYGNSAETAYTVLGEARLDTAAIADDATSADAKLYLYNGENKLEGANAVLLNNLEKNKPAQISAVVWLDGETIRNSDVSAAMSSLTGTLNLQFITDTALHPAENSMLRAAE